eukprot:SAG11_NODE_1490_length_4810_cov_4.090851_2_plen_133_part_00
MQTNICVCKWLYRMSLGETIVSPASSLPSSTTQLQLPSSCFKQQPLPTSGQLTAAHREAACGTYRRPRPDYAATLSTMLSRDHVHAAYYLCQSDTYRINNTTCASSIMQARARVGSTHLLQIRFIKRRVHIV